MFDNAPEVADMLRDVLQRYWGFDGFRPLQEEAMRCVLDGRDSVVVMPTGGGKSLCYQAPALELPGLAVVVSPLISLMKDQVDSLRSNGIPAAYSNSTLSNDERVRVTSDVRSGTTKLLYVSPERLVQPRTIEFLKSINVSLFAIDEAHCVSEWGHDFRPEYRELRLLRENFPNVGIHAYTATATERVRGDIAQSLGLRDAEVLVGSFDRPNLVYRVERRKSGLGQVLETLDRHKGESGIVYCTTRNDVEKLHAALSGEGVRSLPYHAGMSDDERHRNQDAFIEERVDVIVATVAFGMGIDKSNVRFVVHYGAPKTLENYQQESGRAGRDGLEAECCLFFSAAEFVRWQRMLDESPQGLVREAAYQSLQAMRQFCNGAVCRHKALVNYFGQDLPAELADSCGACDVCLGQLDLMPDALVVGQKILSSVVRQEQRFGAEYTTLVLKGSKDQRILQNGHERLSTYGLLAKENPRAIRDWIEQLVGQGFLKREKKQGWSSSFEVLTVTPQGWELLRGKSTPRLLRPAPPKQEKRQAGVIEDSWDGVDRGLFEQLRTLRREKADALHVPAYIVFTDTTLRDMARRRPTTLNGLHLVKGVGEKKLADFGEEFVTVIAEYCRTHNVVADAAAPAVTKPQVSESIGPNLSALAAFRWFREGKSIKEVAELMSRAESTVSDYLSQFIRQEGVTDPAPWVEPQLAKDIEVAALELGLDRLRPIFERFNGTVSYEQIRPVVECLRVRQHFGESPDSLP